MIAEADAFDALQRMLDMHALDALRVEALGSVPDGEDIAVSVSAFLSDVVVTDLVRYFPQLEPGP